MSTKKFHPDNTTPRGKQVVFVFGSNLAGRHGAGAAKVARVNFGAAYGVGSGPTGRAYAIPTKGSRLEVLPLAEIEQSIQAFLVYAASQPKTDFFVTRIGCGLAGFDDGQIAPLFAAAPDNCSLPEPWQSLIGQI
jgi:hypothetical protein